MSVYSGTILGTTGLVSYWQLNETTGTTAADSQGTNPLTYGGGYTLGAVGANANLGTAVTLSKAGTGRANSTTSYGATTNASLECWFKSTDSTSTRQAIIFNGDNAHGYGVFVNGNGTGNNLWILFQAVRWMDSGYTLTAGWHHLVLTMDGSGVPRLYVDATLVYTGTSGSNTPVGGFGLGSEGGSGGEFNGSVDEAAVYSVALSQATITAHYNAATAAPASAAPASMLLHL